MRSFFLSRKRGGKIFSRRLKIEKVSTPFAFFVPFGVKSFFFSRQDIKLKG